MEGGYGWIIVCATFLINGIVQGVIASSGILLNVLLDQFKVGKAITGWIPSLLGGLLLAVGPLSGYLVEHSSCRTVTIFGALIASFGCFLSSLATGVGYLIFSYGVVTGVGFGLMYLPQTIILAEWFKEKRSSATGIGLSGAGFGAFIIPPLSQYILYSRGWEAYFVASGCLILLCCIFGLFLSSNAELREFEKRDLKPSLVGATGSSPGIIWQFLTDPAFILFCVSTGLFSGSYRIPFSFLPDYAVRQLDSSKSDAAYLLSYLGIASFLGRLIGGFVGDSQRHRRFLVYMCMNVLSGLSVETMGVVGNYFQLALCSLAYGAASGGRVALNSIILADIFGLGVLKQTFGLVCLVQGISIFFGSPVAGLLADFFGDYRTSFVIFGTGMLLCASVLSFIPPGRRSHISNYSERKINWGLRILPMVIVPFLLGNSAPAVQAVNPVMKSPNIVVILADDLGWNDVSFHGYNEIPTPNIDRLAREGVILNSHYAHYMCTPSRAALMTGKYPIRTGMQHYVLRAGEPRDLPLTEKILPQYLKDLGYSTHMIGKWHLGYSSVSATPGYRGFDSFFGYYTGTSDYYNYTPAEDPLYAAFDLWDGLKPAKESLGHYATDVFTAKAVDRITSHNFDKPLFLYLSHMAPHYANVKDPVQAPKSYIDRFNSIVHEGRRKYAATVSVLDDSVGQVFEALKKRGATENSVIMFMSDNGGAGAEQGLHFNPPSTFANNWPLRGAKASQFEGGIRTAAMIWSPLIHTRGRVSKDLYHITDWLPTLYQLAGGTKHLQGLDGLDIWSSVSEGLPSPRTEILYQADPVWKEYAIRWNEYKLVAGSVGLRNHRIDQWYEPENGIKADLLNHSPGALKCDKPFNSTPCNADTAPCLFDIEADPCEYNNLAQRNADVVDLLLDKIREYNATALPSVNIPQDPRAQASVNGGLMRPWIPVVDLVGGVRSLSRGSPFTLFLSSIILRCW